MLLRSWHSTKGNELIWTTSRVHVRWLPGGNRSVQQTEGFLVGGKLIWICKDDLWAQFENSSYVLPNLNRVSLEFSRYSRWLLMSCISFPKSQVQSQLLISHSNTDIWLTTALFCRTGSHRDLNSNITLDLLFDFEMDCNGPSRCDSAFSELGSRGKTTWQMLPPPVSPCRMQAWHVVRRKHRFTPRTRSKKIRWRRLPLIEFPFSCRWYCTSWNALQPTDT